MTDDPIGREAFDIISFRLADINSYKNLVCNGFIKSANQMIVTTKDDVRKSHYGKLVKIDNEQYRETLYDTVRLSYIGVFHKIEAYAKEVAYLTELILRESAGPDFSIIEHVHQNFGIKNITKCWQQFEAFNTVNWVANGSKHCDGRPHPNMVPIKYSCLPEDERMKLTKDNFVEDCQAVIDFYPKFLELVFRMGQHAIAQKQLIEYPTKDMRAALVTLTHALKMQVILLRPRVVSKNMED
ncbi:MAG: hypothetical protein H6602_14365 [Flavobacteriales bacterium]|nr:hypothetical protein [Flavobacteriales bacterium]